MKILEIKPTVFPEIKIIKVGRFSDNRGYFTETYKKSDFTNIDFLKDKTFVQINESFSKKSVVRGMHFQHSPYQEKLVRVIQGKMIDLFLDIRLSSPFFGKVASHTLETKPENDYFEWIWIPIGFAHGLYMLEDTTIEYYCTSEYSPKTEASISPLDPDIDWSLTKKPDLNNIIISDRDKAGSSLKDWLKNPQSKLFKFRQH